MTKTLTIEMSEDLSTRLDSLAATNSTSLQELVLQTMQLLATSMQSLQDESPRVRSHAAQTLGFLGTEISVSALGQALNDQDPMVRKTAAGALRQIGTESALALLSQASSMSDFDPISALIGTLELETTDLAEHHDRYLAESIGQELNFGE